MEAAVHLTKKTTGDNAERLPCVNVLLNAKDLLDHFGQVLEKGTRLYIRIRREPIDRRWLVEVRPGDGNATTRNSYSLQACTYRSETLLVAATAYENTDIPFIGNFKVKEPMKLEGGGFAFYLYESQRGTPRNRVSNPQRAVKALPPAELKKDFLNGLQRLAAAVKELNAAWASLSPDDAQKVDAALTTAEDRAAGRLIRLSVMMDLE